MVKRGQNKTERPGKTMQNFYLPGGSKGWQTGKPLDLMESMDSGSVVETSWKDCN